MLINLPDGSMETLESENDLFENLSLKNLARFKDRNTEPSGEEDL